MRHRFFRFFSVLSVCAILFACVDTEVDSSEAAPASGSVDGALSRQAGASSSARRYPYFGDLHVHSSISLDSYIVFARNSPHDVFRFAKGMPVELYGGKTERLVPPLDFVALTDHAEFLGELEICRDAASLEFQSRVCEDIRNEAQDRATENRVYQTVMLTLLDREQPVRLEMCGNQGEKCIAAGRTAWQRIQKLSNEYYEPGVFTTLIGYEWSSEYLGNQHRNVIFRNEHVPSTAWSAAEYKSPEELWAKLDNTCEAPCEAITISHNPNQSEGRRFSTRNSDGSPLTREQAAYRMSYEPLLEIMQVKGESECRTGLGTIDEDCNFEKFDLRPVCSTQESDDRCVAMCELDEGVPGCVWGRNYARNALKSGLELEQSLGVNPFKIGFVGSTDTHNSNPGDTAEDSYVGSFGFLESDANDRLLPKLDTGYKQVSRNPGGLAGVWAEENTRDSIFDALKRRETFATSGTRILVRFFAGWDFPSTLDDDEDLVALGYRNGVTMGSDLSQAAGESPRFIVWAMKGVDSANLYKAQIIKGWYEEDGTKERVYDVACSDGHSPDPATSKCPETTATVDLSNCSASEDSGSVELKEIWTDPDFDARQKAFYYLRVLENPACRWSTYDALRLGRKPPADVPAVVNERAWSSPIWYSPANAAGQSQR